jgi:Plasmid pRiA4b ORF-3-like protein
MPFQFKIQIKDIQKAPVWRRVIVSENITFDRFHKILQAAFGWENCHLYQFSANGWGSEHIYKIPDEEYDNDDAIEDSTSVKLSEIFSVPKQTFFYIYDFGDDWKHQIILEKILDEKIINAICTEGKGACPPEDCGGPWGYLNLLETLADPKHPDYKEIRKWLGLGKDKQWDVNAFDIQVANDRIHSIGNH